jgi:hypothetical protein
MDTKTSRKAVLCMRLVKKGEADRHVAVPLEEQRICGLRRKPFWIILVIAIVLVKRRSSRRSRWWCRQGQRFSESSVLYDDTGSS